MNKSSTISLLITTKCRLCFYCDKCEIVAINGPERLTFLDEQRTPPARRFYLVHRAHRGTPGQPPENVVSYSRHILQACPVKMQRQGAPTHAISNKKQIAQLSQRGRAMLRDFAYFAKWLKVIRNDTVE